MERRLIQIAGASRPHPGEIENGDAWHVRWHEDVCVASVIDGLGHGPEAAAASAVALQILEEASIDTPVDAIRRCHTGLRGTRGVVMGVARIDVARRKLTFAGVGNTDALIQQTGVIERFISFRGIVGSILPTIRTFEVDLTPGWCLLMHTDGVKGRFDPVDELREASVSVEWLNGFLDRWARETDDATVLLAAGD